MEKNDKKLTPEAKEQLVEMLATKHYQAHLEDWEEETDFEILGHPLILINYIGYVAWSPEIVNAVAEVEDDPDVDVGNLCELYNAIDEEDIDSYRAAFREMIDFLEENLEDIIAERTRIE